MKIFEIGTGYTSIPARMGAATEIVVEELTTSLLKLKQDVSIVDIKDKYRQKTGLPIIEVYMPQIFSSTDIQLGLFHKLKRVLYSISLTHKLHCLIRRLKGEEIYLHFHNQYNLFFFLKLTSASLRRRVMIGYTVHSYIWFGDWNDIKDKVGKRYFQEIYCFGKADQVFVLNDAVADMLKQHYNIEPSRISVVINGVNTDKYTGEDRNEVEISHSNNLEGKRIVFQVGSVCDRKNQLGTLKLLAPLMKKDDSLAYMYAGGIIDPDYKTSIDDFITSEGLSGNVHYMGEVSPGEQLNRLYAIAKCSVMNSKSEAFALVIAESLSARRPIFINQAILSSILFLGKNVGNGIISIQDTFADDLYRLLDDENYYRSMQEKGREFIMNNFSWDIAAKMYLNNFKNRFDEK